METLIILGIIFFALNKGKNKENRNNRNSVPNRRAPNAGTRPSNPSTRSRSPGYVDDGVLTQEEAISVIVFLNMYKEADTIVQQDMLRRMDARIVAQFNHLMNSTWNMDTANIMEYLTQQGRQGRYTELGAYTMSLNKQY